MKLKWGLWVREPYCINVNFLILMVYCGYIRQCPCFLKCKQKYLGVMGTSCLYFTVKWFRIIPPKEYDRYTEIQQMWQNVN